jgi:hypothetical protein
MSATPAPPLAVFAAPRRYVQGKRAPATLGAELERLGASAPLALLDPAVRDVLGPSLQSLGGARVVDFGGEC